MSDDNQWDPTAGDKTQGPTNNVTDIESARIKADAGIERAARKAAVKAGDDELSTVRMSEMLTLRMADDDAVARLMPTPTERIAVVLSVDGKRRPLQSTADGLCRYVDLATAAGVILRYCHAIKTDKRLWSYGIFEWRHARAAAEFWLQMMPPIQEPAAFRFADDTGLAFHRIPFIPEAGPSPLFDAFIERMVAHQRRPFLAWCGSLYFLEADRQQYLWLWGQGGDGKGAWARHLQRVFGSAALAQSTAPDPAHNKHCYVPYENKRLVVYPELNESRAIERLKSLTGGDRLYADVKNVDGHDFDPICKLLILSNRQPSISSQKSDTRRPIIVEMTEGVAQADPAFEAGLWEERCAIAAKCIATYRTECPGHRDVPQADEALEAARALGSMLDEEFEMQLEYLFNRNPSGYCLAADFQRQLNYVEGWRRDRRTKLRFATWLAEVKGIRKRAVRVDVTANPAHAYVGITVKDLRGGFGL